MSAEELVESERFCQPHFTVFCPIVDLKVLALPDTLAPAARCIPGGGRAAPGRSGEAAGGTARGSTGEPGLRVSAVSSAGPETTPTGQPGVTGSSGHTGHHGPLVELPQLQR